MKKSIHKWLLTIFLIAIFAIQPAAIMQAQASGLESNLNAVTVPTPKTPAGIIVDRTPKYTWAKISGATQYQYQLYRGTTLVYSKVAGAAVCGATTCSSNPTNLLGLNIDYRWRVRAQVGGVWKAWSVWKFFTVKSPFAPTPKTPVNVIYDRTPQYVWGKVNNATSYQYQLFKGAALVYTKTVGSAVCGTLNCLHTPPNILGFFAYKWRVRAKVNGIWRPWSPWKNFTVSLPGFSTNFNTTHPGWATQNGAWAHQASQYYTSAGVLNKLASINYKNAYKNGVYEVRMRRNGSNLSSANTLIIRGTPKPLGGDGNWANGYYFQYSNKGTFAIWKRSGTVETPLVNWTESTAINKTTTAVGQWNTLKVVFSGPTMKFYINNQLVKTVTDAGFVKGYLGIGFSSYGSINNRLWIDWAKLTNALSVAAFGEQELPGVPLIGGSIHQSP